MNKGWIYAFFLYGVFLSYCDAQPLQHTDLIEYGLKGKVKVLTSYSYQILKTENGELIPVDTNQWYRKETVYFNETGNVDSVRYLTHNHYYKSYQQYPDTSMPFANTISKKYFYDTKGKKKTGVSFNNHSDQAGLITISWPKKNLCVEASMIKGDDHAQSVDSIWIGTNGRDSVGVYSFYTDGDLMPFSRYEAYYNDQNELDYFTDQIIAPPMGDLETISVKILQRDKNNNWIKSTLTLKGEQKLTSVLYRSYIYY